MPTLLYLLAVAVLTVLYSVPCLVLLDVAKAVYARPSTRFACWVQEDIRHAALSLFLAVLATLYVAVAT